MGNDTKMVVKLFTALTVAMGLVLFFSVGLSLLLAPPRASAASTYDQVIQTTGDFTIGGTYGSNECRVDASNWYELLKDETLYHADLENGTFDPNLQTDMDYNIARSSGWSVSIVNDGTDMLWLNWVTPEQDDLGVFKTYGNYSVFGYENHRSAYLKYVWDYASNSCKFRAFVVPGSINIGSDYGISYYHSTYGWGGGKIVFFSSPIQYPEGYSGIQPSDTWQEPLSLKPNFLFISSEQWKGRFMDTNVATYDGTSEFYTVCDDDLAPIIIGNITNGTWIQEFSVSATAQVDVTLPESTSEQTFTITGRYSCAGHGAQFDTDGIYEFKITQYGTLDNNFMKDCVNADEPSIDFGACIENMQNIVGLLTFGQLKLNKNFENVDSIQCRNLQVLGSWIFKPGAYVCPAIPSFVRNTITPFVLLALGYGAANFLRKRNETI